MPRQSMNTHASQLRAKRRGGRRSSPAIWLETFPAVRWTFDSFSNLKATRSRRWKSFRERWSIRFDHCSNIAVLENQMFALSTFPDRDIHHGAPQVVGANHLIWEQRAKHGVNHAQQPIAEIWLPARFHRVNVGGPEDVNTWKPGREQCFLGLSLVACKRHSTASRLVRASPAQE